MSLCHTLVYGSLNLNLSTKEGGHEVTRSVEVSAVNLMVGWKRLICCRKVSSDSWPCSQMASISPVYRHQTFGLVLVEAISFSSRFTINRFAYDGTIECLAVYA